MNTPPLLFRLIFGIVRGGAASVEIFLHRRFGVRYLSTFGPLGAGLMAAYAAFIPPRVLGPLFLYFVALCIVGLLTLFETWLRFWRGDNEHSGYGGYPRLLRRDLAHKEYLVKQIGEPLLVACIGNTVVRWNGPLGLYLVFAAVCLVLVNAAQRRLETREAIMLHDAALVQQHRAARFREIHGLHG